MDDIAYLDCNSLGNINLFMYCENNSIAGFDPNGNINWLKFGAIALVAATVIVATVATFGASSVAGTIAITSTITLAAITAEVTTLQIKKSIDDGDSSGEIFSDVVDAISGNAITIFGFTPFTKSAGYFAGIYNQSNVLNETLQLIKFDGFNLKNFVGGISYALKDRWINGNNKIRICTFLWYGCMGS